MGLVEVLVAGGLLVTVAVGAMALMRGMNRDVASLSGRGELEEVRQALRRRLSCRRTFPANVCAADPTTGLVPLRDDFNNLIFTDVDPGTVPGKAMFANSYRYGKVRIRTQCGAGSVQVRIVAYDRPDMAWPLGPSVETCQEVLGGTFTNQCPPNQRMQGINAETLEPICVAATYSCPGGTYLAGMSFDGTGAPVPDCRAFPAATCPNGFIKGVDFTTNAITCTDPQDGSKFGGLFVIVGGQGAGSGFPSTPCPPGILGAAAPCGCYTANSANPGLGCACPAGFQAHYTNAMFDVNPGTNWGGGFGCTGDVSKGSPGCGWALGMCSRSF